MPIAFTKKQSAFLFFPAQFSVQLQLSAARSFMDGSIQTTGSLFLLTKGRHSMEFLTHIIFLLNLLKTLINHFSWWVVALSGNSSQSDFGLDQVAAGSGDYVQSQRPFWWCQHAGGQHRAAGRHQTIQLWTESFCHDRGTVPQCSAAPVCTGLPRISDPDLRGHLCGIDTPERANLIFCWCSCSTVSDASQMKRHLS